MFKTTLSQTYRVQDTVDAWHAAAHDARNAWETWRASASGDRGDAYLTFADANFVWSGVQQLFLTFFESFTVTYFKCG